MHRPVGAHGQRVRQGGFRVAACSRYAQGVADVHHRRKGPCHVEEGSQNQALAPVPSAGGASFPSPILLAITVFIGSEPVNDDLAGVSPAGRRRVEELERQLKANEKKARKDRLSLLRIHEDLGALGYGGGYDAVRRYARTWRRRWRLLSQSQAFVPLSFDPGEAYQFDWSHEYARLSGVTTKVKAAHMRLCYSRMQLVQIFPRESQEMVFEAHERAFRFFGGVCRRGIYDNMKTAVSTVFVGKKRDYNRRFQEMCSHHLVEPVACTPGAGWEKGQVERQVGDVRGRLFVPSPRGRSYAEINEWLMDRCIEDAKKRPHPTIEGKTVSQVFEEERPFLMAYRGPFDGFHATEVAVSKTCLVRFDNNQYSVAARAVGRPVDVRAYADRIAIRQDGEIVAEHPRSFGRGRFVYDPWHYVPILTRKPGALRNGAPFKGWQLPNALGRLRTRLAGHNDGDRQFVKVLAAVQEDGLEAVEAACAEALDCGACSADVVLNILARQRQPAPPAAIPTPEGLQLRHQPVADCQRYDSLREAGHGAS